LLTCKKKQGELSIVAQTDTRGKILSPSPSGVFPVKGKKPFREQRTKASAGRGTVLRLPTYPFSRGVGLNRGKGPQKGGETNNLEKAPRDLGKCFLSASKGRSTYRGWQGSSRDRGETSVRFRGGKNRGCFSLWAGVAGGRAMRAFFPFGEGRLVRDRIIFAGGGRIRSARKTGKASTGGGKDRTQSR